MMLPTPAGEDRAVPHLRVVHVVCTDNFAGVERYVVSTATEMASKGVEVTVVGGDRRRMPMELQGTGVTWLPGPTVRAAVAQLWRLGSFDIVHAHMFDAELASVISRPRVGRRLVATRHFARTRGSTPAARLVGRALTRLIRAQLSISHFVAERVEGESVVIEPGVPNVDESVPATARDNIVLMVQRLDIEKQGEVGIRAFAGSGLPSLGWRLVIAGAGTDRKRLEGVAAMAGVARSCDFLGASSEVHALLKRAGIFMATRPDEPFGLSVVEAMAAGVPVVGAAGGGHLETVGCAPGAALFPPGAAEEAGVLLAALAGDLQRRQDYGHTLRQLQRERFTVERQVRQTLQVYLDTMQGCSHIPAVTSRRRRPQ
jgi:glycosyltransferase involved in cell wall biosynthesis